MREINIELGSDPANVVVARMAAAAFIAPLDPSVGEVTEVKTAVSEAVTNAMIHGYGEGEGVVRILMRLEEDFLTIAISDDGVGIQNVAQAREPLFTSKPELERSGLGFTMMENFMDILEVESSPGCGTQVVMAKRLNLIRLASAANA